MDERTISLLILADKKFQALSWWPDSGGIACEGEYRDTGDSSFTALGLTLADALAHLMVDHDALPDR